MKRRVSLSETAAAPPVEPAIVIACSPTDSLGSGSATSSKAVPRIVVFGSPSDADVSVNATGSPSLSPEPYARRRRIGSSVTRYSGASVASTKNGRPTGTRMNPDPASGTDVIAAALTCHEVRSSESLNETRARPRAPFAIAAAGRVAALARAAERQWVRRMRPEHPGPDPPVQAPEGVLIVGRPHGKELLVHGPQDDRGRYRSCGAVGRPDVERDGLAPCGPLSLRRPRDRQLALRRVERGDERADRDHRVAGEPHARDRQVRDIRGREACLERGRPADDRIAQAALGGVEQVAVRATGGKVAATVACREAEGIADGKAGRFPSTLVLRTAAAHEARGLRPGVDVRDLPGDARIDPQPGRPTLRIDRREDDRVVAIGGCGNTEAEGGG